MRCFIFDPFTGAFSCHMLRRGDAMPFTEGAPLYLAEFLGSARCGTCWTDRRFLAACAALKSAFPRCSPAFGGFQRAAEGRALCLSRRTAGLTLHAGQFLPPGEREALRRFALTSGLFSRVAPEHEAPTWVELEGVPLCPARPFPRLRPGEANTHVFALQDALALHGFPPDTGLTGCFSAATERALALFCKSRRSRFCGVVTADIWRLL